MVKLVEGLTSDFRAGWTEAGRKSVENRPDRLLFSEKYLKQTKLPIGKKMKLCCLHRFEKRKKGTYILYMWTL